MTRSTAGSAAAAGAARNHSGVALVSRSGATTCATVSRRCLQQTGDLAALQAILGRKTVAMTMRYSHLMTDICTMP